jgi:NAD(P)-dependent dehydrogenase (short-subunit alcohol dehydrogenase family)
VSKDFEGRSGAAVVAGGSGGLGAAVCRTLAERGSDVALTFHRNAVAAAGVVQDVETAGQKASAEPLALEDEAAVETYLDAVVAQFGGIHTLVYAAGPHVPMVHLSRVSPADFRRQIDHDVIAFFNLVHAALPHLRATKGNVVAVTTVATRRYPVRDGLSAAPKGAVEAMVRGFAAEEGRFGVRLNCVGPGMMVDGMAERLISSGELDERALDVARNNIPLREFGTAIDIAEAVAFLASDKAKYITGLMLDVDGGYHL